MHGGEVQAAEHALSVCCQHGVIMCLTNLTASRQRKVQLYSTAVLCCSFAVQCQESCATSPAGGGMAAIQTGFEKVTSPQAG